MNFKKSDQANNNLRFFTASLGRSFTISELVDETEPDFECGVKTAMLDVSRNEPLTIRLYARKYKRKGVSEKTYEPRNALT